MRTPGNDEKAVATLMKKLPGKLERYIKLLMLVAVLVVLVAAVVLVVLVVVLLLLLLQLLVLLLPLIFRLQVHQAAGGQSGDPAVRRHGHLPDSGT